MLNRCPQPLGVRAFEWELEVWVRLRVVRSTGACVRAKHKRELHKSYA